jgi:hypothetical protein
VKKRKIRKEANRNPYHTWPLGQVTTIEGVEVRVAFQNAGMTFFSPVKDESDWGLLRGLIVFKVDDDGSVSDCYRWGPR